MNEQSSNSKSIPRAVGAAIVIGAVTSAGYVAFVKGPSDLGGNVKDGTLDAANKAYDLARRIAKDVDGVIHFRPKVTCGGTTVVEASRAITELSTIEKRFGHTHYYESTWLGSTKRIKLKGRFVAKAGYDLTHPFSIDVSEDRQTIRAIMPPAQILSVELTGVDVLQDENGWRNKLSSEERQRGLNSLLAEARKSLGRTSLLSESEASFLAQLEKTVRKNAPLTAKIIRQPLP